MLFNKRRSYSPAAQRFEPQRPGAAEQINRVATAAFGANEVKERLTRAVLHGAHGGIAVVFQSAAAKGAPNNVDLGLARIGTTSRSLVGRLFAFSTHWR